MLEETNKPFSMPRYCHIPVISDDFSRLSTYPSGFTAIQKAIWGPRHRRRWRLFYKQTDVHSPHPQGRNTPKVSTRFTAFYLVITTDFMPWKCRISHLSQNRKFKKDCCKALTPESIIGAFCYAKWNFRTNRIRELNGAVEEPCAGSHLWTALFEGRFTPEVYPRTGSSTKPYLSQYGNKNGP